jgi:hypothetical protein
MEDRPGESLLDVSSGSLYARMDGEVPMLFAPWANRCIIVLLGLARIISDLFMC